jgi:hypothetical protein
LRFIARKPLVESRTSVPEARRTKPESNDVMSAELFGDLGGPIGASVIDHEHLNAVDAGHGARQVGHGRTLLSALAARVKPPRSWSG